MRIRSLPAAAAALLIVSIPGHAQDPTTEPTTKAPADTTPRTSLQKGTWSLSFHAPVYGGGGTGTFGVWEMVGSRTNLGLTLLLNVSGVDFEGDRDQSDAVTGASVGLNLRRYLAEPREVTPYVQGTAMLGGSYQRREDPEVGYEVEDRGIDTGLAAAVGAEWFPVRRVSLAGHTGVEFFARRFGQHREGPDDQEFDMDGKSLSVRTFTTALTLQIYF